MMKKTLFALLLVLAAAGVSALVTSRNIKQKEQARGQYEASRLSMQLEFIKNNSILRPITDSQGRPDLQKYIMEVNTLAGWYFKNLASKFWQRYPGEYDAESIIKEKRILAQQEGPNQQGAKNNLPIREECYELTRGIYDQLKEGTYSAPASGFQGSVRFDVHKVLRDGNKLKWIVLVWGGIGTIVYNGWHMKWFKTPTVEEKVEHDKEMARAAKLGKPVELKDPASLHFAESVSSAGRPVMPDFEGSEYIVDFPPGAKINYFYTSSCHPEAERLEIEFRLSTRLLTGEDQKMQFIFAMPVEAGWKGSWQGVQEVEATSDYQ